MFKLTSVLSRDERGPEYSIFVGDLGPEVNEYVPHSVFQNKFPLCKSAKIMSDPISGLSSGYDFVRFTDESDPLVSVQYILRSRHCPSSLRSVSNVISTINLS
jgi:hypothetical protein